MQYIYSSVYFPGKIIILFYFMRHPHIFFLKYNNPYILHLITKFIQTRIYNSIGMKPIYIHGLYFGVPVYS